MVVHHLRDGTIVRHLRDNTIHIVSFMTSISEVLNVHASLFVCRLIRFQCCYQHLHGFLSCRLGMPRHKWRLRRNLQGLNCVNVFGSNLAQILCASFFKYSRKHKERYNRSEVGHQRKARRKRIPLISKFPLSDLPASK
jgi:hypothetical protein